MLSRRTEQSSQDCPCDSTATGDDFINGSQTEQAGTGLLSTAS
jgi:hypothetical protein